MTWLINNQLIGLKIRNNEFSFVTINIVLPQTKGKDGSVKDLIVSVLVKERNLNTRSIYNQITRVYAITCTYQAVHKSLVRLVKDGVLIKKEMNYSLNPGWLDQLKKFSEDVQKEISKTQLLEVEEGSLAFYGGYLDNYRHQLAISLRPKIFRMQNLFCSPLELSENGNRLEKGPGKKLYRIAIESQGSFLLLGPPGAGKSTALLQIAYRFCILKSKIPVYFNLTSYIGQNLEDVVRQKIFETTGEKVNIEFIEAALQKGAFIFLLDGLNELSGTAVIDGTSVERAELALGRLNHFLHEKKYSKNRFIVACRNNADPKDSLPLTAFSLKPLSEKQIKRILKKRGLERLFKELKNSGGVYELCSNPLLLDMTMTIFSINNTIPSNRTELYTYYFDNLIYGWESKNIENPEHIAVDLTDSLSRFALETIPFGTIFPSKTFYEVIRKICRESGIDRTDERKILDILLRTNIIQVEGVNCRFFHHSFQEFFSARELKAQFEAGKINDQSIGPYAGDRNYLGPLVFLSGLMEDSTPLIELLRVKNIFLAGECLISSRKVDTDVFDQTVNSLIKTVGEKNLTNVWYAVDLINRIGSKATNLVLEEIESGKDPDLKRRMYWVAGGIQDPNLNKFLVDRILKENDPHTIDHFLLGLQEEASKERAHISESFLDFSNEIVKGDAFVVLKNHGLANENLLKNKKFDLNNIKDKLVKNLDSREYWTQMHSMLLLGKLKATEVSDKMIQLLGHETESIAWYATLVLSQIGDPETPLTLRSLIEQNPKNAVYRKALEAFERGIKDRKSLAKIWSY